MIYWLGCENYIEKWAHSNDILHACKYLLSEAVLGNSAVIEMASFMSINLLKHIRKYFLLSGLVLTCACLPQGGFAASEDEQQEQEDNMPDAATPAAKDEKPQAPVAAAKKPSEDVSLGNYLAGRFAESQGDTGNGIQFLRESLKRDPDNKDTLKSLYRMLILSGNMDEIIPLARKLEGVKVVDDGSEFSPEMLLAISEVKAGHYAKADKYLATVPKAGYNSLLVPLMRAWLRLGMEDVKTPLDARSITPEGHAILPHVYLNVALINDIAGFDKEAQKQYEESVKDSRIEPFRAVEALANFYERKGMTEKRDKLVNDYLAAHGDTYLSDTILKSAGNPPTRLVSNATEGVAEVIYTLANIFHGVRTPGDEVGTLHLALYLRPDFPAAQFLLASAFELGQDYRSALATYKAINPASPYFMRGRIRSAYDEIGLGNKDVALSDLDKLAKENTDDIEALLAKGDILRASNQYNEALTAYDGALARVKTPQKRHWVIYFARGATYQLAGQMDKSEADMKKALELDSTQPEVLNFLGYSWLTQGQNISQAKKMIEDAYNARPEDAHIIDSMGYALYVTGDFASAEEYFDQALERTPNDPTVNEHLGDTYWQVGRKTEARYQWERALGDGPDPQSEKDLQAKLKDGVALIPPSTSPSAKKPISPALEE